MPGASDMKRSALIREIADMLERELKGNPLPVANATLLDRLRYLKEKLNGVDEYAFHQVTVLAERAAVYYSGQVESKYPDGPDALFEVMMGYVHWVRLQALVREEHQDTDEVQA
ncbi:MAG: hypothetical protein GEV05_09765 [Betaproteobacteria bacterium]|nr:hypothetical protein [Betaproteobacteria bacterium]